MRSKLRAHVTYANVVGSLALFVALGGTSFAVAAGSIDSREIKNNTVRSKDIRNNQVRSRDVRNFSLLRRDFKLGELPAGPAGPAGQTGPRGPAGATNVVVRTSSPVTGPTLLGAVRVMCAPGERATGGGAYAYGSDGFPNYTGGDDLLGSGPVKADGKAPSAGETPTGWVASFGTTTGATRTARVYVVCALP